MDFMTMMQTRKSIRSYEDKPVAREDLIKIVEVGRLTPSACNSQPWKFIVVDEPEAKAKVCDALQCSDGHTGCTWGAQVPAFIILVEEGAKVKPAVIAHYHDSQRFAQGDIGAACMNMCHMAMELGLSTCIVGMNEQKKMEENLGIPEGKTVRLTLAVGYGIEVNPGFVKQRKPLEEVVSFNQW